MLLCGSIYGGQEKEEGGGRGRGREGNGGIKPFKSWEEEAERKAVLVETHCVATGALSLDLVSHCDS